MKKVILIFSMSLIFAFSDAQTIDFTKADPQPNLVDVYGGSFDSGDIDGDGDIDLIMAGITPGRETALYLNDGNGNFTEVEDTPFPDASRSVTIFEDLDGDGDLDLFFSGLGFNIQEFAHVYLNNGMGEFTQTMNQSLPVFADSGVDLRDLDGDGFVDILIAVENAVGEFIADVFINNGEAIFTPSGSTAFTAVKFAKVEFIDVENDGDADVIISGEKEDESLLTTLYLNDGAGNFIPDTTVDFVQLNADDIDVADTDNDGDLDILMSGTSNPFDVRTILYINDGDGQFSELTNSGLQQTFAGTNAMADLDNDGDLDIVIIGSQDGGLPNIYNIVYENMGNNEFFAADTIGGEYIAACVVDDFNGDELADIIIQGFVEDTNVYWNTSVVTSVDDILSDASIVNVYPNPSGSFIRLIGLSKAENYTIYDILGKEITSGVVSINDEIDIQNLANGTYILKIEKRQALKIMKN